MERFHLLPRSIQQGRGLGARGVELLDSFENFGRNAGVGPSFVALAKLAAGGTHQELNLGDVALPFQISRVRIGNFLQDLKRFKVVIACRRVTQECFFLTQVAEACSQAALSLGICRLSAGSGSGNFVALREVRERRVIIGTVTGEITDRPERVANIGKVGRNRRSCAAKAARPESRWWKFTAFHKRRGQGLSRACPDQTPSQTLTVIA